MTSPTSTTTTGYARIYVVTSDGPMSADDTPASVEAYLAEHDATWGIDWFVGDDAVAPTVHAADLAALIAAATDIAKHYGNGVPA